MAHIHQERGGHDQTVSAFIVRMNGTEPRLLLHRHKKLGVYMQVGGHIERTETSWQAISHELREESGYELDQLNVLQPPNRLLELSDSILHPIPMSYNTHLIEAESQHYHSDMAYGFATDQAPRHRLGEGESDDIVFVTKNELETLRYEEIFPNVREIGRFMLEVCLVHWEQVPAISYEA